MHDKPGPLLRTGATMQRSRAVFITAIVYAVIGAVLAGGGASSTRRDSPERLGIRPIKLMARDPSRCGEPESCQWRG